MKTLYYYHSFITKDTTQEQPNGRDAQGEFWGREEHRVSMPSPCESKNATFQYIYEFANLEAPLSFVFQSFYGGFITQAQLIKSLVIWLDSISSPPLFPRWKLQLSNPILGPSGVASMSLETI